MRKYIIILSLVLLLAVIVMSCSSTRVRVNFDDQFDFSKYRTFSFVPIKKMSKEKKPGTIKDPIFLKKTAGEISAVLTDKGFRKAEYPKEADFLVAFYAIAKNKVQITPPTYHIGRFGRRWVRPGHVYQYKEGSLIIDIVDRRNKELVWRGVGSQVLDRSNPTKNLVEVIQKVLAEFPPTD